jgi:hypothetical protein
VPNWLYTSSKNGWTSNRIAQEWLLKVFVPDTRPKEGGARILIMDGHGSHVTVDFLWSCKQYNIQLVFLPPHSSHVLQPLDLSCFSPVKTRYRAQIAQLATLDDSAPVKKARFIDCYHFAREEGLTERTIRGGWSASGISPWNPEKVLSSSQLKQQPATPKRQKRARSQDPELFRTPQKPQDLYKASQALRGDETLSRSARILVLKAGKAIGKLHTDVATLQVQNEQLQVQLNDLEKGNKRRKVPLNSNKLFATVENVKAGLEAMAKQKAIYKAREPALEAQRTAAAVQKLQLEDMIVQWQL